MYIGTYIMITGRRIDFSARASVIDYTTIIVAIPIAIAVAAAECQSVCIMLSNRKKFQKKKIKISIHEYDHIFIYNIIIGRKYLKRLCYRADTS